MRVRVMAFLSLFTSTGTLLCCALPALLGAIAGGAAVSSFISAVPWVVPLSRYKAWLFLVAGLLLAVEAVLLFRPRSRIACAVNGGEACEVTGQWTRWLFWSAVLIYGIGFAFAYALVPVMRLLGV
ncbi:MAG: hypothetical protein KatS3mg115_2536 [Candidatus Poribacteria bacterium]|nr:MAG: hypothetical protein KatS3mg115_2536 [Candidatus Poribacteria bacterium]